MMIECFSVANMPINQQIREKSWAARIIPRPNEPFTIALGDPALVADDSGYFYYSYLANTNNNETDNDNIVVATSKDGKTWKNGSFVIAFADTGGFEDKEQITIDNNPSSPHYHRLYVVWMHFADLFDGTIPGSGIRLAYSDDRGKTGAREIKVGDEGNKEFSEVKTGKNGEVFVAYSIPDFAGGGSHAMHVSTNGGNSFIGSTLGTYNDYPLNFDNRGSLKGDLGFRCFPYIASDVDLKTNQIHLVYGSYDQVDNAGNSASILYYISSHDLGKLWTKPKPVGIANPAHSSLASDRFHPWVSVNQKTGAAYVLYYSSEDDPENILVSMYRTKLSEDMADYPQSIGDRDFDATIINSGNTGIPAFIGDYTGSDAYDTVYAASWTECRTDLSDVGDIFVYIATPKHEAAPTGSVAVVIRSKNLWLSAPNPNPINGGILSFSYYLPQPDNLRIELYSSTGMKVLTLAAEYGKEGTYTNEYPVSSLASGEYLLRLSTNYGSIEKKVVVVR